MHPVASMPAMSNAHQSGAAAFKSGYGAFDRRTPRSQRRRLQEAAAAATGSSASKLLTVPGRGIEEKSPSRGRIVGPNKSRLLRSQSVLDAHMTPYQHANLAIRYLIQSVPFMAMPGVSSELNSFKRIASTVSIASLNTTRSFMNLAELASSSLKESHLQIAPLRMSLSQRNILQSAHSSHALLSASESESSLNELPIENLSAQQMGEAVLIFQQAKYTWPLIFSVFIAILSSFQVGYNSAVLNVPESVVRSELHSSQLAWSLCVAIFCLGGLVGSYVGGKLADQIGRKSFLISGNVCFIIGGLCELLSFNMPMLTIGRFIIGVGCGAATVVVPLYLGEIAPAEMRGMLGTMNQFSLVIGILIACLLGKPLGTGIGQYDPASADYSHVQSTISPWRYLLGLAILPALLQMLLSPLMQESPLWLVFQGDEQNLRTAEEILSKLRGHSDVKFDLECMKHSRQVEMDDDDHTPSDYPHSASSGDDIGEWSGESGDEYMFHDEVAKSGKNDDFLPQESMPLGGDAASNQLSEDGGMPQSVNEGIEEEEEEVLHEDSSFDSEITPLKPTQNSDTSAIRRNIIALFTNPAYRLPITVGFVLMVTQQFSGINAVFYYSTMFFNKAHVSDPWMGSVLACAINVLATGLALQLMDRLGRRVLLLISSTGMAFSCIALTITLRLSAQLSTTNSSPSLTEEQDYDVARYSLLLGYISVLFVLLFVTFFELGLGPIAWLIGAEIFPSKVRATAMTLSSALNWICNFVIGVSFPMMNDTLGAYTFVPFAIVLFLSIIFIIKYVPETRGKTLDEIQKELMGKHNRDDRKKTISSSNHDSHSIDINNKYNNNNNHHHNNNNKYNNNNSPRGNHKIKTNHGNSTPPRTRVPISMSVDQSTPTPAPASAPAPVTNLPPPPSSSSISNNASRSLSSPLNEEDAEVEQLNASIRSRSNSAIPSDIKSQLMGISEISSRPQSITHPSPPPIGITLSSSISQESYHSSPTH